MLRAAVYARYSSGLQKSTSAEDQIALCREAAPRFDCIVSNNHIYTDLELSGTTDQRPDYQRLLNAAKQKPREFEAIIVESQDRLWRDQGDMHRDLKHLRFCGIHVFSVATGSDIADDTGKLMATIVGLKDEVFIEDLRKKTRRGMMGQIRRGMAAGGRPYGYRSEPVIEASQITGYRRVIKPDEAKVVRRIFKLYSQGKSPRAIVRILNSEKVPSPRPRKGQKSLGWSPLTIAGSPKRTLGILHNPLYVGRSLWNRSQKVRDPDSGKRIMRPRPEPEWIEASAPELRIISDELWKAVQERHAGQFVLRSRGGRRQKHLLSGLLVCAECGSHYTLRATKPDRYGCAVHFDRGGDICPNGKLVRRDKAESAIFRMVSEELFSPDVISYLTDRVNKAIARRTMSSDDLRKQRAVELNKARKELENVKKAILNGLDTGITKEMLLQCAQKVDTLEAELKVPLSRPKVVALSTTVMKHLADLRVTFGRDSDRARSTLRKLVSQVVLRRHGDRLMAEVTGNLNKLLDLDAVENDGAGRGI